MIREKRRAYRIDQMKKGESINTGAISDDSDEEGEFEFSTAAIEDNFTNDKGFWFFLKLTKMIEHLLGYNSVVLDFEFSVYDQRYF